MEPGRWKGCFASVLLPCRTEPVASVAGGRCRPSRDRRHGCVSPKWSPRPCSRDVTRAQSHRSPPCTSTGPRVHAGPLHGCVRQEAEVRFRPSLGSPLGFTRNWGSDAATWKGLPLRDCPGLGFSLLSYDLRAKVSAFFKLIFLENWHLVRNSSTADDFIRMAGVSILGRGTRASRECLTTARSVPSTGF